MSEQDARRGIRGSELYRAVFHPGARFRTSEIGRSIVRHPPATTPRGRSMTSFHNFFLHVYPVKVPRAVLGWRATLRLGFIATVLFAVLFVSGTYLMFFYHPAVPQAYFDMHALATSIAFGQFVRNIHRWSAHLMVLVVFVHLIRVFVNGAYKAPRQFNWLIGVGLLVLTLLFSFTGYLLPWDQLSFWAITVGTNIAGYVPMIGSSVQRMLLGGAEVGGATLLRFYVLHIYALPVMLGVLLSVHVWRVRKDGFAAAERDSIEPAVVDEVIGARTGEVGVDA